MPGQQRDPMGGRIPQTFINEIIARADLVDIVGQRVSLKKAGSNHKGLCPFHDEKTPSFTVSPTKGFYKCFGCGAYGNVIDFIMQYENRSFPEAIEILADLLRLDVPVTHDDGGARYDDLYACLKEADQTYREALRKNPAAIDYLKQRGIDGPTAAQFGLGYAPDAWDTMLKRAGGDDAAVERLIRAGLVLRNESGRTYDRFRGRIMFPIRDTRGRVIGFGGRALGDAEPKYLNSPDTPLFDKSRTLYGLFEARQQPGRPDAVIVVEGYADVIALAQHGVGPAIATMGTATTADNVRQVTRMTDQVIFCFDGDRAGRQAAWRALASVMPYAGGSVAVSFLVLPEGEDPDSFVRAHGASAFRDALESAVPLVRFLVDQSRAETGLSDAQGRGRLLRKLAPLLEQLPSGINRDLVLGEVASLVDMSRDRLEMALARPEEPTGPPRPRGEGHKTIMQKAITLVVHYPQAASSLDPAAELAELDVPGAALLRGLLEMARSNPDINTGQLVEAWRDDDEGRYLRKLASEDPLDEETAAETVLKDCVAKILARERRRAVGASLRRWGRDSL